MTDNSSNIIKMVSTDESEPSIQNPCPEGKILNSKTKRCVKSKKQCTPGKVRDEKGRCKK